MNYSHATLRFMSLGFWEKLKLKKPILVLAPMADVTDVAFRSIIAKYGKPDVMWTEFVSADGLMSIGREHLEIDLAYSKKERPIVAQLFSSNPEKMEGAAKLIAELGFDGLDINMGCPDKSIMKQGSGGAMIRNPKQAVLVIEAAKRGVEAGKKKGKEVIPVSVKTRIGYNKNELATWLPALLSTNVAAITIHARTVKELSLVPARWEHVTEAVKMRNDLKSETLILGNGDAKDCDHARVLAKESGADGVMLGRAIFGRPWLFSSSHELENNSPEVVKQKLAILLEHVKLFDKLLGKKKSFALMKKHFKAYVNGFDDAKELRLKLMECNNAKEVGKVLKPYL